MQKNEILTHVVTDDKVLDRADIFIKSKFPQFSRSQIQKLISAKNITINNSSIKSSTEIKYNDKITIKIPKIDKTPLIASEIKIEIIYQNSELLIVNKPHGIVVHPSKGHSNDTVINALLGMDIKFEANLGQTKPFLVHRLDKDTSGLLLVAKNEKMYSYLTEIQKKRKIKKHYLAVIKGVPDKKHATIDASISRNKSHRKKMSVNSKGRKSLTTYKVIKSNDSMSLVELELHTGRTHQIRVHMQALGHPIIGDTLYGKKSKLIDRQLLHAYKLEFKDNKNNVISVQNEPEKDMKEFIEFYFNN
ncbi:RluA family pseudouridine synthase [Chloroflexi bacterium]|nr:RluA family pseudouridine synthase [Chloroflexota bacterium]